MFETKKFVRIRPLNFIKISYLTGIIVILLGSHIAAVSWESKTACEKQVRKLDPLSRAGAQFILLGVVVYNVVQIIKKCFINFCFLILVLSLLGSLQHHLEDEMLSS